MSNTALLVNIHLQDARWKKALKPYCKTVRLACEAVGARGEVAVVLADDNFIRQLNKQYRGKDKPTNVLSFSNAPTTRHPLPTTHLGDIILAFDTIEREAAEQQKTFKNHAIHLMVHGMLHLLGHDHEAKKDAEIMETKEIKILKKLGVDDPYA